MTLQIPPHIVNLLQERGLNGDPNEWPFRVVPLSGERAYLWFGTNDGYVVLGDNWISSCMADAVQELADETSLSASALPLRILKGHTRDVLVYPDGSLAWEVKKKRLTASWQTQAATKQLQEWSNLLLKASNSWWLRITRRAPLYLKIAKALAALALKIEKR